MLVLRETKLSGAVGERRSFSQNRRITKSLPAKVTCLPNQTVFFHPESFMSEYQYYEFRAIDRPLTEKEMDELRKLSSRADITPTSFVNVYNYSDFRGDERKVMEKYFDIFVYLANWGSHRLIMRFPKSLFSLEAVQPYLVEEFLETWTTKEFVLVEFRVDEEPVDWEEGEGWLDGLLPLREDLLRGDLRSLYIGWLSCTHFYDPDFVEEGEKERTEPPLPPGMKRLTKPLKTLAEFLFIDTDLLETAAQAGTEEPDNEETSQEMRNWIAALPDKEKTDLLCRLVEKNPSHMSIELLRRFQEQRVKKTKKGGAGKKAVELPRRTIGQLLEAAKEHAQRRKKKAAQEKAAARKKHLQALAKREKEVWQEIDQHVESKKGQEYDLAVKKLADLIDLGKLENREEEIAKRIRDFRQTYKTRRALIQRFDQARLPK